MNKTYQLYDYYTGNPMCEYTFEGEPQNGDKIQPGGVGSPLYTIARTWEDGQLIIKLVHTGLHQRRKQGEQ